ncbi:MAG: tetratricopeptide repeat protein [Pseudomonadota bacterium]
MIFRCANVELDTSCFTVTRGGKPVSVSPKAIDLLAVLIRNRHRLVSRDELLKAVWHGRMVSDAVLSNEIKHARAVLGDDGRRQSIIRTVRGRGYQFIGEVIESGGAREDSDRALPQTLNHATSESVPRSVAVLPFDNRSNDSDDAYFTDGFHDELITQISRIRNLVTISRTSVMTYRNSGKSSRTIGRELGTASLIEGGVLRSGRQIRINVRLIDAAADKPVWAKTYTRELAAGNVFAIQREIALEVGRELRATLSPKEKRELSETPTENTEAMQAYFRGRLEYGRASSDGFSNAVEHFSRAIDLDPEFAEAHAQLAMALLEKVHFGGHPVERQNALAEPHIESALSLKPELSEAYEAQAFLERHRGRFSDAEVAYENAIALNPNNTSALRMYGYFRSWDCERPDDALPLFDRARLLDPQNHHTLALFGQALMDVERFDESEAMILAAIQAAPNVVPPYQMLGQLNAWKLNRHDRAVQAYRNAYKLDPNVPWTTFFLGVAYEELGIQEKAVEMFERYLAIDPHKAFSWIVRLKLGRLEDDPDSQAQLLSDIIDGRVVIEHWHDRLCLDGFDCRYDHPELAVRFFETQYPALTRHDLDIASDNGLFRLALAYATVLHLGGQPVKAEPLTEKLLPLLPSKSRYRCRGIDCMDAWLFMAMGDERRALDSLNSWRELGGCRDIASLGFVSSDVRNDPVFAELEKQIRDNLSDQRNNLEAL